MTHTTRDTETLTVFARLVIFGGVSLMGTGKTGSSSSETGRSSASSDGSS